MLLQPPNRNPDESDFISTGVNQTSVLSVGPRHAHKVGRASVGGVCCRWIKTFLLAMFPLALGISQASAVAIISDPFPTAAEAANIAALTNQYLQAAASATTAGGWLDASPSGTAADRGQSLLLPSTVVPSGPNLDGPLGPTPPGAPPAGNVIISYSATAVNAIVSFNDGSGNTGTLSAALAQFVAGYGNSDGSITSFYTFCIDLAHTVSNDQSYAAMPRTGVAIAFTNGAEMAYVIDNFGAANLAPNPDQAAAVQIALWDLSLNNHDPTSFALDADGSYSSGDADVFNVRFAKVPEASSGAILLVGTFLLGIAALLRARDSARREIHPHAQPPRRRYD